MARASKHGGPSLTHAEAADPSPPSRPARVRRPEIGKVDREPYRADRGAEPSVGNSSTASTPKPQPSENSTTTGDRKRVRTTENRSRQTARDSGADSTAGSGPKKTMKPSDDLDFSFDA